MTLSDTQFRLLSVLVERDLPGVQVRELSGLSKSSMATLLMRLYERGLVSMEQNPDDGRSWIYGLTKAGRDALKNRRDELVDLLTLTPA